MRAGDGYVSEGICPDDCAVGDIWVDDTTFIAYIKTDDGWTVVEPNEGAHEPGYGRFGSSSDDPYERRMERDG